MKYTVKKGDTIYDVCYNANGSLYALDENLALNNINTYTPDLTEGTELEVSDIVRNNAAVETANEHPFNSTSIPEEDIENQLIDVEMGLMFGYPDGYLYFITSQGDIFETNDNLALTVQEA